MTDYEVPTATLSPAEVLARRAACSHSGHESMTYAGWTHAGPTLCQHECARCGAFLLSHPLAKP